MAAPSATWPPPIVVPDLAAWATLMPADPRTRVDEAAMAALPSQAPPTDTPLAAPPPGSRAEQNAATTAAAGAAAQSNGTALTLLIQTLAAQGPIDPNALASGIDQIAGATPEPPPAAEAALAEHAARPAAPDNPTQDAPISPTPTDPPPPETTSSPTRATRTDPPPETSRWGSSAWTSPSAAPPAAVWGTVASSAPQDFPPPSGAIRSIYRPLDAPQCAPGLLAGLANVANLYRRLSGRTLADPASLRDLAGTIESFNACLAQWPDADPPPAQMAEWAAAGRGLTAMRTQMGVDLLQPNAGPALQAAIRERQAALATPVPPWMAQRAEVVTHWLELDQLATALDLPTRGPGALARLGSAARLVASASLPPCASPTKASACLAHADNLTAIREGFGIDPLSADGPARLQQAGASVSRVLASSKLPPSPGAETARGLNQNGLQRLRQIDRAQAGDLGLRQMNPGEAPVLTSAPLVLSVLDAICRQLRASIFASRPGRMI